MNRLFLLLLIFSFASCKNNNSGSNVKTAQAKVGVVKEVKQVANKPIPSVKADSIEPRKRSNYTVSKSRSKNDINKSFPFDIDLKKADGSTLKSADVLPKNGKPTVLLFWLTTCYPCRIEMNNIQKVYNDWKEETDFNLVAISTDFEKNYGNFAKMVNTKNWPWEAYNDVNREFRLVLPGGLNGLPQTFIFDKNGEIAFHKRKYSTGDEHKLYDKIKELAAM